MKKFFLFKRKDVNVNSGQTSETGEGLDVLAISTDLLAFMTASLGKVNIVFNNATVYEENNLLDGESFKKTSVSVACEEGEESSVIESIMKFISSDRSTTNVMRFDAVSGAATIGKAKVEDFTDVVASVRELPVIRTTQESSKRTFIGSSALGTTLSTGNVINEIDFGDGNKPIIDLHEENLSESGGNVNGWTNAGSGGSTYNIASGKVTGTIPLDTTSGRLGTGLSTKAADMSTSTNFELDNTYVQSGDFTMFAVIGKNPSDILNSPFLGCLVQGTSSFGSIGQGQTFMFNDGISNKNFTFQFAQEKGGFIKAASETPIIQVDNDDQRTAYIFVIRRDIDFNISVYDNDGAVVAFVPSNTTEDINRTDGNVVVEHLGNGQGLKFQGNLARFGVIAKDIGGSKASQLALDLARKYTPIT
tara:strand:+ start:630 stop:1886 length:1257 start_codon:yes stop_codon:yes gene_type:complete